MLRRARAPPPQVNLTRMQAERRKEKHQQRLDEDWLQAAGFPALGEEAALREAEVFGEIESDVPEEMLTCVCSPPSPVPPPHFHLIAPLWRLWVSNPVWVRSPGRIFKSLFSSSFHLQLYCFHTSLLSPITLLARCGL